MHDINPEVMYHSWLSGLSIRNIGKHEGLGRMSVHATLTKHYGKDATNLRKQSLARVVYQEYGDIELAMAARGSDGLYRTARAEKNYSRCQTYEVAVNNLSYVPAELETEINLNTYLLICELTCRAIVHCQIHNNRMLLASKADEN